jgi:hypothetical protein
MKLDLQQENTEDSYLGISIDTCLRGPCWTSSPDKFLFLKYVQHWNASRKLKADNLRKEMCYQQYQQKGQWDTINKYKTNIQVTSLEVNLSRCIIMERSEFPWAAIITCFPATSWGTICRITGCPLLYLKVSGKIPNSKLKTKPDARYCTGYSKINKLKINLNK